MESDPGSFAEPEPELYLKRNAAVTRGKYGDRLERDPMSDVAVLVCAPTPPHAPFFVSGNIASLLGYGPQELVGNTSFWMKTVHPEDFPQLLSGFFHLFTRGYHIYDYRFLRKNGAYKRLLVELRLHRRHGKEPIAMVGFLREPVMTDEKFPRDEKSEAEFFGNGDAARLTIDSRHGIRDANPRMGEVCGLAPKDMIGRFALDFIPPDYMHLAQNVFQKVVNEGRQPMYFWHAIQRYDGSLKFVAVKCSGSHDRNGELTMVITCKDITALVTLDEKSRTRRTTRLLSALSRGEGVPSRPETCDSLDRLTGREREILYLTIEGLSSTQIGERLSISPRTVEAHRAHIMNKLGVHSLSQLIRYTVSCIVYPEPA
jgi:PAS domain S-box-containing protein